jgi:DNA repair photolyase
VSTVNCGVGHYQSPRLSGEIYDCSMPVTLDTYSGCSYGCLYCFSNFQREIGPGAKSLGTLKTINAETVKRIFTDPSYNKTFGTFLSKKFPIQWGGLSDQFDENERKHGVTLELLRFFREIEYPISFSTKSAWWVYDKRYRECFEGFPWWNVKFSIITLEEDKARVIENECPTPKERLSAMKEASQFVGGGVTLRLRPFIIGLSERTCVELIQKAAECGATAVSTEFFCMETRSRGGKSWRYPTMSRAIGFDIEAFYKQHSRGAGYLRLNREVKREYVDLMEQACKDNGLRFYVSDAHFKERCANGSCCGLPETWHYNRGQQTQAVVLAKRQGTVRWSEISEDLEWAKTVAHKNSDWNNTSSEMKAKFFGQSMYDYLRYCWNHPTMSKSPYQAFGGILKPVSVDEEGNVVYKYDRSRE